MTHVIVYGTLKKGQPNHYRMLDAGNGKAEYCGRGRTVKVFPLVVAGKYNIPRLLNLPGTGHRVVGEVYRVDARMLAFLDDFECCPDMYQRTTTQLEVEEWVGGEGPSPGQQPVAGSVLEAFIYSTTSYQPEWLQLPHLENYDAYDGQNPPYVTRECRD